MQPGDWWCGRCSAFNWRQRWRCINCGRLKQLSPEFWRLILLLVVIVALAIALAACAPRTLRTSVCMKPAPGLQACTFHYEGDEQ